MALRKIATLLACLLISFKAFGSDAAASGLEASLMSKYADKVFTLRGFYSDDHLHFDRNGAVLGDVHSGSWTTAAMEIKQAKVSADKIELKGSRLVEVFDSKISKFTPRRAPEKIVIVVDRDATQPDSVSLAAIDQVFVEPNQRLADAVPDYWRPIVSGEMESVPQEDGTDCNRIRGEMTRTANGSISMGCEEHAKVKSPDPLNPGIDITALPYSASVGVTPPRLTYEIPPSYSQLAELFKFEGTTILGLIVKADGSPSDVEVVRPLGFGLDDQAVEAVRKWKFAPATLSGQAVPTRITVEVAFHLGR